MGSDLGSFFLREEKDDLFRLWPYFVGDSCVSGAPASSAIKSGCPLLFVVRGAGTVNVNDGGSEGTVLSSVGLSALGEATDPDIYSALSVMKLVLSFNSGLTRAGAGYWMPEISIGFSSRASSDDQYGPVIPYVASARRRCGMSFFRVFSLSQLVFDLILPSRLL